MRFNKPNQSFFRIKSPLFLSLFFLVAATFHQDLWRNFARAEITNTDDHAEEVDKHDIYHNGPYTDDSVMGGLRAHRPGLKVRVTQRMTELIKTHLFDYGVEYINYDHTWEKEGWLAVDFFPFFINAHYNNLVHDPIKLDLENFNLNFTHMASDNEPVVYMQMPLIKEWHLAFDYDFSWCFIPFANHLWFDFYDVDFVATITPKAT